MVMVRVVSYVRIEKSWRVKCVRNGEGGGFKW